MVCEPAARWLQYDRSLILRGQIFRLMSCHLTHWSYVHALWSGMAFIVLAGMCERQSRLLTMMTISISALAIGGAIWWLLPQVEVFRGLSGIDSALLGLVAVMMLKTPGRLARSLALAAMILFVLKLGSEMLGFRSVFLGRDSDIVPLPTAHLVGFVTGICASFGPIKPRPQFGN